MLVKERNRQKVAGYVVLHSKVFGGWQGMTEIDFVLSLTHTP
jgi:hypothetical protein